MSTAWTKLAFISLGAGASWTLLDAIGSQMPTFVTLSKQGLKLPTLFVVVGQVCIEMPARLSNCSCCSTNSASASEVSGIMCQRFPLQAVFAVFLPSLYLYKHVRGNFSDQMHQRIIWGVIAVQIAICVALTFSWTITVGEVMAPLLFGSAAATATGVAFDVIIVPYIRYATVT
jgi:hypothetical protein